MENKILFSEKQRFTQWWLWGILILLDGVSLYGLYQQVIAKVPFGNRPMEDSELFIAAGLMLFVTLLFGTLRLETLVKKQGIYVRFFPFHLAFQLFTWDKIEKVYIRSYRPLEEYGGWGLRFGFMGNGRAYTVSGHSGLQIEFTSGKKLLIGSKKPVELAAAVDAVNIQE